MVENEFRAWCVSERKRGIGSGRCEWLESVVGDSGKPDGDFDKP